MHRPVREKSIDDFEFQLVHGKSLIYHWKNGKETYSLTEEFKFQISDFSLLELKKTEPLTLYIIYTSPLNGKKKFRRILLELINVDGDCLDFEGQCFMITILDSSDGLSMTVEIFGEYEAYGLGTANEEFVREMCATLAF